MFTSAPLLVLSYQRSSMHLKRLISTLIPIFEPEKRETPNGEYSTFRGKVVIPLLGF